MDVVRTGVVCDFEGQSVVWRGPRHGRPAPGPQTRLSFSTEEFAELIGVDGGRFRVSLSEGLGFNIGLKGEVVEPWSILTIKHLTDDVLTTVLPDDAEVTGEAHRWDEFASTLRRHGVDCTAADLAALPYVIEFSGPIRTSIGDRG